MARTVKRLTAVGAAAVLCLSLPAINAMADEGDPAPAEAAATIDFATYNILSSQYDDLFPDDKWADRRDAAAEIVKQDDNDPDILGVQEGQVAEQVDDLVAGLGDDWEHYAADDDISARAIFWRESMFDLVEEGTVEVIDSDVDAPEDKRHGSWVLLQHLDADEQLAVFNFHLPSGSAEHLHEIRYHAALAIAESVEETSADNGDIPVIVLADLNSYYDTVIGGYESAPKTLNDSGFPDTYGAASPDSRVNPDYKSSFDITQARAEKAEDGTQRVDYIHVYPADDVEVLDWRMIINFDEGSDEDLETPVPSDHHPVASQLHLTWS